MVKTVLNKCKMLLSNWAQRNHHKPRLLVFKRERSSAPRFYITVVVIAKDEAPYLDEWINFHKMVGVEHFYFYDNLSSDNTLNTLNRYIKQGIVTRRLWRKSQKYAYYDAIMRYGNHSRWMIFIDIDEFIFPTAADLLTQVLSNLECYSAILLPWKMFGSGGHVKKPEGLVIENYRYRTKASQLTDDEQKIIKTKFIIDPVSIKEIDIHDPITHENNHWQPDADQIVINHYYVKSLEELDEKIAKRRVVTIFSRKVSKVRLRAELCDKDIVEDLRI